MDLLRLTFNVRDWNAKNWDEFWKASKDPDAPIEKFGFVLYVIDIHTSANRIATACQERMKYVKNYLRGMEDDLRKMGNYQIVHDCKSHRAMKTARKQLEHIRDVHSRWATEIDNLI